MHATVAVSDAVREVKANSSRWIHETWPDKGSFAWQRCYGAFSVSESNSGSVRQYIAGQAEHHRVVTYKEEFVAFLEKHNVEYEPKWVWE